MTPSPPPCPMPKARVRGGVAKAMTLREHLDELRKRLIVAALVVIFMTVAAFVFRDQIIAFLLEPGYGDRDDMPIATEVLETVGVTFKVTLMAGFVGALPVVLYQMVRFVAPGLTKRERVYLLLSIPGILVAFAGGAVFAYYILLPPALRFLFDFGSANVDAQIRIASYMNVVTSLMFWMGVVFQIPLVMFVLARLGVVTPRLLSRFRKWAIVLAFVAAAIITPTFDPVNQVLVAIPIILLYELGIVLARLGRRLRGSSGKRTRE